MWEYFVYSFTMISNSFWGGGIFIVMAWKIKPSPKICSYFVRIWRHC